MKEEAEFPLFTNNQPLANASDQKSEMVTVREVLYLRLNVDFTIEIRFIFRKGCTIVEWYNDFIY